MLTNTFGFPLLAGGIQRVFCFHLTHEILETGVHVPIPFGRRFVERDPPLCFVLMNRLLRDFAFIGEIEFGAYHHYGYILQNDLAGIEEGWRSDALVRHL